MDGLDETIWAHIHLQHFTARETDREKVARVRGDALRELIGRLSLIPRRPDRPGVVISSILRPPPPLAL